MRSHPRTAFASALAVALGLLPDDLFGAAQRLPPDLRPQADEVITLYRRRMRAIRKSG